MVGASARGHPLAAPVLPRATPLLATRFRHHRHLQAVLHPESLPLAAENNFSLATTAGVPCCPLILPCLHPVPSVSRLSTLQPPWPYTGLDLPTMHGGGSCYNLVHHSTCCHMRLSSVLSRRHHRPCQRLCEVVNVAAALDIRLQLLQRQRVQHKPLLRRQTQVQVRRRAAQLVVVIIGGGGGGASVRVVGAAACNSRKCRKTVWLGIMDLKM